MEAFNNFAPDLEVEKQRLKRKEKLAEQLLLRGLAPLQQQTAGGYVIPVSPLEGIGKLLAVAGSQKRQKEADEGYVSLGERYNSRMAEGVQDYLKTKQGSGIQPDPQELEQAADQGTPAPVAAGGDPKRAMTEALLSRNPVVRSLGGMDYTAAQRRDEAVFNAGQQKDLALFNDQLARARKLLESYNLNEGETRFGPDNKPLASNPRPVVHAIPDNWESMLPGGAERLPNDPKGVFRLKGTDGQSDVYSMEFDRGALKGYKKLDSSQRAPVTRITNNHPAAVTVTEITDPRNPAKKIKVDARAIAAVGEAKFKERLLAGDTTGVIGHTEGVPDQPKPKVGYVWNADGTEQQMVKGGPVWQKAKGDAEKDKRFLDGLITDFDDTIAVIGKVIGDDSDPAKPGKPHPGLNLGSGLTGIVARRIPGVEAKNYAALLETLNAKISFDRLAKMRRESPTGGALGSIAVRELDLLGQSLRPTDPQQSPAAQLKNLTEARDAIRAMKKRLSEGYSQGYSDFLNAVERRQGGGNEVNFSDLPK